ncbi:DNA primase [Roseimicrobium sp. ORNL1]|uniref:DNA primase n=1 Tax=Roseimicrobium sp. ORNL1 TaxID=2711231 RepID=UPI0013E1FF1F|nr:DNA primase [Roseimicrobium sp. ORNL1]QIE99971.1 DNA primase [Roseimicrobium sp. ORNL1]
MPRIPEETIQQVLEATDIVDLIGRHVKLRKAGVNFVGLCPFHSEKTPSFNVRPQQRTYHCFGCGAGGNAFRFLMEHSSITFVEAVKRLAEQAGIRIEEEVYDANAEREAKVRKALLKVHEEAVEWFHLLLMRHKVAEDARAYLKSRAISPQTAKDWQMGYAPPYGDMLREWALEKKFTENLLVTAGLLARPDEDSGRRDTYPRFRHRLMFPIRNEFGECIAFSGRVLDKEAKAAKYLNSPETPIFSKSRVFFGFDKSKRAINKADRAIVTEGQLDMITAFANGVENVVAPLGTAFTEFHAKKLKQISSEVVLCFDSDNAGYKAAERAFTILAPTGLSVKVAPLPQGEDPDSLIRGQGVAVFQEYIGRARDFFDHMLDHASANRNLSEVRERSRFAGELASMVLLVDNNIVRDAAVQNIARRLNMPEDEFRRQIARAHRPSSTPSNSAAPAATQPSLPPQDRNAIMLFRNALADEKILNWLRSTGREEILQDLSGCELLALVWKSSANLAEPATLAAYLSQVSREEEVAVTKQLSLPMPEGGMEAAECALENLEAARLNNLLQIVQTHVKQRSLAPEEMALLQERELLLTEIIRLRNTLQNVQRQVKQPELPTTEMARLQEREQALRKEYLDRYEQLQKFLGPTAP